MGGAKNVRLVVISGLSGSGKSYVIKYFEDLGFFCIDNLPPPLLPKFVELCNQSRSNITKAALGIDIRERDFLGHFLNIFDQLKEEGYQMELLFLEADDEVLVRRFSETRRPHPLARDGSIVEGIRLERQKMNDLRRRADKILDTSNYHVHQLKEVITQYYLEKGDNRHLNISLISFGYKFGIPYDLDLLFDVRFLANPNFERDLKSLTGEHSRVQNYITAQPEAKFFLEKLYDFLDFLVPLYEKEGKSYLTIGIGCTGGRHRSVSIVNFLREHLQGKGLQVHCRHRDLGQPG
ncbi:MAG: RNase adapter RapZ [Nitrospirae bacterium]|nr:RNase adapter RapZ [Candidatus Manganitrophaceae bacterium]